jgi:hypothetical protein
MTKGNGGWRVLQIVERDDQIRWDDYGHPCGMCPAETFPPDADAHRSLEAMPVMWTINHLLLLPERFRFEARQQAQHRRETQPMAGGGGNDKQCRTVLATDRRNEYR